MTSVRTWLVASLAIALAACGDSTAPRDPAVALDVAALPDEIDLGDTVAVGVRVLDAAGRAIAGRAPTLTSSAPGIVQVLADGRLIGRAAGSATLHLSTSGENGPLTADVTVSVARLVRSLTASERTDSLFPGDTVSVVAVAYDRLHATYVGAPLRYSSSDTSVIVVDSLTGVARAVSDGAAAVTVRAGSVTATVALRGTLPRLALAGAATAITMSPFHGCVLVTGGAAYCWGAGAARLGDGTSNPSPTKAVAVVGGLRFASIDADRRGTCALTAAAEVWCWGESAPGNRSAVVPTRVVFGDGSPIPASVRAHGDGGGCAVDTTGVAWCWGSNVYQQLGRVQTESTGLTVDPPRPVPGGLVWRDFKPGFESSCGQSVNGTLYCNGVTQRFSSGIAFDGATPTAIDAPGPVSQVTVGWNSSCALDVAGAAWCAGGNSSGELGLGTTDTRSHDFARVSTSLRFTRLRSSFLSTCGLTADGELWCWGLLGHAIAAQSSLAATPRLYSRAHRFVDFAVSAQTACGVASDGAVYCGQLALGNLPKRP